jgi:hypothetical protein
MTIQTGSRSRRDCGVLARRYWRHHSFITDYVLVARGLMEFPPTQRVLSEERSARPRPGSTTYVPQGR